MRARLRASGAYLVDAARGRGSAVGTVHGFFLGMRHDLPNLLVLVPQTPAYVSGAPAQEPPYDAIAAIVKAHAAQQRRQRFRRRAATVASLAAVVVTAAAACAEPPAIDVIDEQKAAAWRASQVAHYTPVATDRGQGGAR